MKIAGFTVVCTMLIVSCAMSQERKEKPIEVDSQKRVIKTFDGFVYNIYDKSGRLIEYYGNNKRDDDDSNFRTIITYSEDGTVVTAKTYHLEDNNTKCIVKPNSKYHLEKYHKKKDGILFELYQPIFSSSGKVIDHKLIESSEADFIPYTRVRAPKADN